MNLLNLKKNSNFLKAFKIFTFFSCLLSFFILLSSFVDWIPGSSKFFAFNTKTGLILRIFASFLFLFPAFCYVILYWSEIEKKYIVFFLLLIFFSFLATLYTPWSYFVLYRTSRLGDNFMASYFVSVSLTDVLVGCLSFAVDVLFGYALMFIYPKILSLKSIFSIFTIFTLIILYSCLYSLIFERNYYLTFLSGNWKYTNNTIGSIFINKQQWGIFLISAIPVSAISIFLGLKVFKNKILKVFFIIFNSCTVFLAFACSIVAFCKTAILANFLFLLFLLIYFVVHLLLKHKTRKIGVFITCFLSFCIALLVILLCLPNTKIHLLYQNIIDAFNKHSSESIGIRATLAIGFLKNVPSYSIPFGIPKPLVDPFVRSLMPEVVNGLHTGYVIFFARTGVFGLLVLLFLCLLIFKEIKKIFYKNKTIAFILMASFLSIFVLSSSEAEILIFSSSMVSFMFNLLLVTFPFIYTKEERINDEKKFVINI